MRVIKRNGMEVDFDKQKIVSAISRAYESVNKDTSNTCMFSIDHILSVANRIANDIEAKDYNKVEVEEIQEMVEDGLLNAGVLDREVAKAYIKYRYLHSLSRDRYSDLMKSVAEKLEAKDVQNQNANVDEKSFGGRMGEANRVLTKDFALNYILSDMAKTNHLNNRIYIHDLDNYAVGNHNCLSIPFDDLLANGFNTRQTDVRPAKSVGTACQLVAVIFQLQSLQQFGGVSATHIDWTMVPYIRMSFNKHYIDGLKYFCPEIYERRSRSDWDELYLPIDDKRYRENEKAYNYAMDMTEKEVRQGVEGLFHNLNTLQSRSGNQLKCVAGFVETR